MARFFADVGELRPALCGGAAHETDGWIDVEEVMAQYRDLPQEAFDREFLGRSKARVGAVYDSGLIDQALAEDIWLDRGQDFNQHQRRFLLCEKAAGLDWGYSSPSQTVVAYGVRVRDSLVVYAWEVTSGERYSRIRERVAERVFSERIGVVRPDAANPSDNDELRELLAAGSTSLQQLALQAGHRSRLPTSRASPVFHRFSRQLHDDDEDSDAWSASVEPVVFSTEKAYGIGEVRRRLEQGTLLLPKRFGGEEVPQFDLAIEALRQYSYDAAGKPLKKNDHVPDALLCLCLAFAPRSTGMRSPLVT